MPGTEDSDRPLVELTHVEKHYGDLHVLKDINLTVKKGEVLVIVGPSGSGKSTMCRTINRLETVDSGDIRIALPSGSGFAGFQDAIAAFRRSAAACRHRPSACHAAEGHVVR